MAIIKEASEWQRRILAYILRRAAPAINKSHVGGPLLRSPEFNQYSKLTGAYREAVKSMPPNIRDSLLHPKLLEDARDIPTVNAEIFEHGIPQAIAQADKSVPRTNIALLERAHQSGDPLASKSLLNVPKNIANTLSAGSGTPSGAIRIPTDEKALRQYTTRVWQALREKQIVDNAAGYKSSFLESPFRDNAKRPATAVQSLKLGGYATENDSFLNALAEKQPDLYYALGPSRVQIPGSEWDRQPLRYLLPDFSLKRFASDAAQEKASVLRTFFKVPDAYKVYRNTLNEPAASGITPSQQLDSIFNSATPITRATSIALPEYTKLLPIPSKRGVTIPYTRGDLGSAVFANTLNKSRVFKGSNDMASTLKAIEDKPQDPFFLTAHPAVAAHYTDFNNPNSLIMSLKKRDIPQQLVFTPHMSSVDEATRLSNPANKNRKWDWDALPDYETIVKGQNIPVQRASFWSPSFADDAEKAITLRPVKQQTIPATTVPLAKSPELVDYIRRKLYAMSQQFPTKYLNLDKGPAVTP